MLPLLQSLLKSTTSSCSSRKYRRRCHSHHGNMQVQVLEDRMLLSGIFTAEDIVVRTGDAAPGVSGNDGEFDQFRRSGSVINDSGEVLYYSTSITDTENASWTGLFKTTSSGTSLIARTNQDIPQIAGAKFNKPGAGNGIFGPHILPFNENGQAVFLSFNNSTTLMDSGYFVGSGTVNSLGLIAEEGGNAPASSGSNAKFGPIDGNREAAINNSGQIAFSQTLDGTDNGLLDNTGIFRGNASGNITEIVQEGQTIPGASGGTFTSFGNPSINDAGQVAFIGFNNNTDNLIGIYVSDGTTLRTVAQEESTFNTAGNKFSNQLGGRNFGVSINRNGDVGFKSGISDSSGTIISSGVFVRRGNGTIREVVRTSENIGGGEIYFNNSGRHVVINNFGDVAFMGQARRTDNGMQTYALFRGDSNGDLKQIVRVEQTVPAGDATIKWIRKFALNNSGQMAFTTTLDIDGDTGTQTRKALFFYDNVKGLTEIVRVGDIINGLSISSFSFAGNSTGNSIYLTSNRDGLNNKGQVTFSYVLEDGSQGVAVVSVVDRTISVSSITGFEDGNWWVSSQKDGDWQTSFWGQFPASTLKASVTGDFNGDGVDDVAGWATDGNWYLGIAQSDGTLAVSQWNGWIANDATEVNVGDFNGDGLDDLVARDSGGFWWVAESQGNTFTTKTWTKWKAAANWQDIRVGDFNNDGRDDIIGRARSGQLTVGLSNGTKFTNSKWGQWSKAVTWQDVSVGDFNGDGRTDITGRANSGIWRTSLSLGNSFKTRSWKKWTTSGNWNDVVVGDFDGDGRDDIAGRRDSNKWWIGISKGNRFLTKFWGKWNVAQNWNDVVVADFNADGKDDLAARNDAGQWNNLISQGSNFLNEAGPQWNSALNWTSVFSGRYIGPEAPATPPPAASPAFASESINKSEVDSGYTSRWVSPQESKNSETQSKPEQQSAPGRSDEEKSNTENFEVFGSAALLDLLHAV